MSTKRRKLLYETHILECGHQLQVWSEEYSDGNWELHAHAPCHVCKGVVEQVVHELFPNTRIEVTD